MSRRVTAARQERLAAGHGPHRLEQLRRLGVRYEETAGAGAQRPEQLVVLIRGAEHDDAYPVESGVGEDPPRRFERVRARQLHIDQDDVRRAPGRSARTLPRCAGHTDDGDVLLGVEQRRDGAANEKRDLLQSLRRVCALAGNHLFSPSAGVTQSPSRFRSRLSARPSPQLEPPAPSLSKFQPACNVHAAHQCDPQSA